MGEHSVESCPPALAGRFDNNEFFSDDEALLQRVIAQQADLSLNAVALPRCSLLDTRAYSTTRLACAGPDLLVAVVTGVRVLAGINKIIAPHEVPFVSSGTKTAAKSRSRARIAIHSLSVSMRSAHFSIALRCPLEHDLISVLLSSSSAQ